MPTYRTSPEKKAGLPPHSAAGQAPDRPAEFGQSRATFGQIQSGHRPADAWDWLKLDSRAATPREHAGVRDAMARQSPHDPSAVSNSDGQLRRSSVCGNKRVGWTNEAHATKFAEVLGLTAAVDRCN